MDIYQFISSDPPLRVLALPGETPAKITDGYGGWEDVERPNDMAFSRWSASHPYKMDISIVIDGFARNIRVGKVVSNLERLARDPGANEEPPIIKVFGPHPRGNHVLWHIENIDWDTDKAILNTSGYLLRAAATVSLSQHVDPDMIEMSSAKRRRAKHKKKKKKKKHPRHHGKKK